LRLFVVENRVKFLAGATLKPDKIAGSTYSQDYVAIVIVIVVGEAVIVHRFGAREALSELLSGLDAADTIQLPEEPLSQAARQGGFGRGLAAAVVALEASGSGNVRLVKLRGTSWAPGHGNSGVCG
jgi:hypothetical protein